MRLLFQSCEYLDETLDIRGTNAAGNGSFQ
jgi:hypothetical protein